ncbi:MAG TPA: HD-GYP domain-containing protein [Gaiellaceae bacterium]|nr:HD-GYP domain-containing protein [Gaiellaceae bacterium]
MRTTLRRRLLPLLTLGAVIAAAPAVVELIWGERVITFNMDLHFYAVGFSALAAALAAAVLTWIGARRGDTRTVIVGTAFAAMASLLGLHGLSTPGIWVGSNGVIALTGGATLPVGAVILLTSAFLRPRVISMRLLIAIEVLLFAGIFAIGLSALEWPSLVPSVPEPNSAAAYTVMSVGLVALSLLAFRALGTFLLTQRGLDLAVVIGLVWLGIATVAALTMDYTRLGWWMGHEIELDGIMIVGIAVGIDLARATQSRPLVGDLSGSDLVASEDVFLGSHVRALTVRLAEKDEYTEAHTRRVALRAVQVGELLGLSGNRLRSLAIGGLVHDIGKLSIPDEILKKPGALTAEEYAVVQRHPVLGRRLLVDLGGFTAPVRELVLDHHERLDGAGYPRGLAGDEISLDVRILTVCDVYDALISKRVYRSAYGHDEAMAMLRAEIGTAFDARCVDALEAVVSGATPLPRPADRTPQQYPVPASA